MRWVIFISIAAFLNVSIVTIVADSWNESKVDLSNLHLQNSEFFKTFQHSISVHKIKELNLSGNALNSFVDCATSLNNLEVLDLSRNRLDRFFFLCKNESYDLRYLNVSHNQLEYISEKALNHRTSKLKVLDMSWNLLNGINDTMLQHMQVLEHLSLSCNPVGDNIDEYVFENLTSLTHLDLRNISVSFLYPKMFENLISLIYLDLSFNPIETIPALPFNLEILDISETNIYKLGSLEAPCLRQLRMNNMLNLTTVVLNEFEKMQNLQILSMKNCKKLHQLTVRPTKLHLLTELRYLDVQGCALETLGYELEPIIKKTTVFEFQNNPWNCDCRMKWILLVNTTHNLSNKILCSFPTPYVNKFFNEIPASDLECEGEGYKIIPILWIFIASVTLCLLVVGIIMMFREPLTHWIIKKRRNGDSVSYTNVEESSNDLVKILNDNDITDRFEECIKV